MTRWGSKPSASARSSSSTTSMSRPPAFHGGDHRLVASEAPRQVHLAQAGGLAVLDEEFHQAALARRA